MILGQTIIGIFSLSQPHENTSSHRTPYCWLTTYNMIKSSERNGSNSNFEKSIDVENMGSPKKPGS